jgi:methylase of polypeptide subunit release factors
VLAGVSGVIPRLDEELVELRGQLARAGYTTEAIEERLGAGRIATSPAELAVHLRRLAGGERVSELVKLFVFGLPLSTAEAEAALDRPSLDRLQQSGWLEREDGAVRATLKLVPHGDLLIASDLDADGPTGIDWVAGMHPPSVTLAKLTVRRPVARALDVATGNGIQALLASRHADSVVATDVNPRALAFAAVNAGLNGVHNVEFRQGNFFEPVERERFDLVTCNPPYVISPESRYAYRDSGLLGDTVSRQVVEQAARVLEEGGYAHLLVSWAHSPDDPWSVPEAWVDGNGCDSWLVHFGSDDPVTHAGEWLRPVAAVSAEHYRESLEQWLEYFERLGIEAIAHGAVVLRRRSAARNWVRKDNVSLERVVQASDHVLRVFAAQDYLETLADERVLLDATFGLVERHHLEQTLTHRGGRTELQGTLLSLDEGLAFRIAIDEHTTRLLPLLDGRRPLHEVLAQQSAELGLGAEDAGKFAAAALPVVRRLVELGFLAPSAS